MPFEIHRGMNHGGWLSQSKRRGRERREFFTREDVCRIAELGFDHLRLPIDEVQMWGEDGAKEGEAFDLMDAALDWCAEAGLRVVVDLHILRSHYFNDQETPRLWTDPAEADRFVDLWRQLSEHLRSRATDQVAYELLNEPVAPDPQDWNRVAMSAFTALRDAEPDRTLVLGSNMWDSPEGFEHLTIPEDRRCILTFHFYLPTLVTHYQVSRRFLAYRGPVTYPGQPVPEKVFRCLDAGMQELLEPRNELFGPEQMLSGIALPLAARERTGLPLYCGEFGCTDHAPDPVRADWHRDFVGVLNANGIAWAHWSYKGGFSAFGPNGEATVVSDALMG